MQFSKRENYRVKFLKLNEDPVWETAIGHHPQREEKDPRTSHLPYDLKPSNPMLQGVLFLILFSVSKHSPPLFLQNPKSKVKFTILNHCDSIRMKKTHP